MVEPRYYWSRDSRRFRDADRGRYVARAEVRKAVDAVAESATREIDAASNALRDGSINLAEWQLRMESAVKRANVATGMVAAGGKNFTTPSDWGYIGSKVKAQYVYLRSFVQELESGLVLDGAFLARARMYAGSAVGTYESLLRGHDIASGYAEERRLLHSEESCASCIRYAALGWQPAGTLPDIGDACECHTNCRCTYERRKYEGGPILMTRPKSLVTDPEKCRRRSRLAALKFGVESAPLDFLSGPVAESAAAVESHGRLFDSDSDAEAARHISTLTNRRIAANDLWIHAVEAGSNRFVDDRYLFLGTQTLKNVAAIANRNGFAFMNSHRTGGLSSDAELPYGRAFAGRFERLADGTERTLLQVYMRRGIYPNGAGSPGTDDIHAAIESGTVGDVSLGLKGGVATCDVCGNGLGEGDCEHVPGTSHGMSKSQRAAQEARGVHRGLASYTLDGAVPREVSAVYKGAVPGAGFRLAYHAGRAGMLSRSELAEAATSYGSIALSSDFRPRFFTFGGVDMNPKEWFRRNFSRIQTAETPADVSELAEDYAATFGVEDRERAPVADSATLVELKAENERLKKAEADRQAEEGTKRLASIKKEAGDFAASYVKTGRVVPTERQGDLVALYTALACHEAGLPVPEGVKLATLLKGVLDAVPKRDFTTRTMGNGEVPLTNGFEAPKLAGDDEPEDLQSDPDYRGGVEVEKSRQPRIQQSTHR